MSTQFKKTTGAIEDNNLFVIKINLNLCLIFQKNK